MVKFPSARLRLATDLGNGETGREAARRLGSWLGEQLVHGQCAPANVSALAKSESIELVEVASLVESGRTEWTRNGLRIAVRTSDSHKRKRFTIAHELAHCLVFGIEKSGMRDYSEEEERRCDCFAGSLLMPEQSFAREAAQHRRGPGVSLVRELGIRFDVSPTAVMYRVRELALIGEASVVLRIRPDMAGTYKVYEAIYDRTVFWRFENMRADRLGLGDVVGPTVSAGGDVVYDVRSLPLPIRLKGYPRHSPSFKQVEVNCVQIGGDEADVIVEIDLLVHPNRLEMLKDLPGKQAQWWQER